MAKCCYDGYCYPAIIYAFLAIVSLVLAITMEDPFMGTMENTQQMRAVHTVFHVFMLIFWTWFIYWLCSHCYINAAWMVLFLPFFIGLVILAFGTTLITAYFVGRKVEAGVSAVSHGVVNVAQDVKDRM